MEKKNSVEWTILRSAKSSTKVKLNIIRKKVTKKNSHPFHEIPFSKPIQDLMSENFAKLDPYRLPM